MGVYWSVLPGRKLRFGSCLCSVLQAGGLIGRAMLTPSALAAINLALASLRLHVVGAETYRCFALIWRVVSLPQLVAVSAPSAP